MVRNIKHAHFSICALRNAHTHTRRKWYQLCAWMDYIFTRVAIQATCKEIAQRKIKSRRTSTMCCEYISIDNTYKASVFHCNAKLVQFINILFHLELGRRRKKKSHPYYHLRISSTIRVCVCCEPILINC